jgi:Tfp pilus assembly protein PilF
VVAFAILAITFVAYLPSLDNAFTNWDDPQYVLENPLLPRGDLSEILRTPIGGNYHPLTVLSLAADYRRAGLDPAAYHVTNLALHVANTALVFVFVWMLTRGRRWAAAVTSLLFGIHPMHVESVAWISERKDVLYAFFFLLGLLAYLKYLDKPRLGWWVATSAAFLLSLASKPAAVVFPVTLLAMDAYRQRAWSPRWLIEKSPWFAMSIAMGLLTIGAQVESGALEQQADLGTRLFSAVYGFVMYLVKLVAPVHLSVIYPFPAAAPGQGPAAWLVAAMALAVVGIGVALYLLRARREVWFGFAFYSINVALVLQFVGVGRAVMADRYTYLPYVGLLLALTFPLDTPGGSTLSGRRAKHALAAALAVLASWCFLSTRARCDVWQNTETLWTDTIQKYPTQIADAYINRGFYYHRVVKRLDLARADYERATAVDPEAPSAWNNRGRLFAEEGQVDSAIACYDRAIAFRPQAADLWNNRGGQRLKKGDPAGAMADFSRAISLDPRFWDAFANRATARGMEGDYEGCIADCRRLIELQPNHGDLYLYYGLMGSAYRALGRQREAVAAFDRAITLAPAEEPRRGAYYLERSHAWGALGDRARELADLDAARRLGVVVD